MYRALALVAASALVATACGGDTDSDPAGAPSGEPRTVEVSMTDNAFAPSTIDASPGEAVRFVFRNDGTVRHEAVFGDQAQQEAHHAEMAEMGGSHDGMDGDGMDHDTMTDGSMPHDMDDLHSVVVEPGETVELMHTFGTAGTTMVGCHEPGHWEDGMRMSIDV